MSRLQDLIDELCPDGVEYKPLWSVTVWDKRFNGVERAKQQQVNPHKYLLAKELDAIEDASGTVKLLTTGTSNRLTTHELAGENLKSGEIVYFPWGGYANIQYFKGEYVTSDNRIATSSDMSVLDNRFLFHVLLANRLTIDSYYRGSALKHPDMNKVLHYRIPVPPIEVQREVVRILNEYTTAHDELVRQLKEEITARELEYETIIREEFSNRFGDPCTKDDAFDKLGNHCRVITGNTPSRSHAEYFGPGIDWIKSDNIHADARSLDAAKEQLTEDGARAARIAEPGWLLMICIAGSPNTIGNTSMVDRRVAYNQQINGIDPLGVNARFLQCALTLAKQKIERTLKPAVTCILNKRELESLLLPFPPREEQDEFAAMLERLDSAGFNDYRDTLREELVLRERQLALMRNQLLSFPEKVA